MIHSVEEIERFCDQYLVPMGGAHILKPTARRKYAKEDDKPWIKGTVVLERRVVYFDDHNGDEAKKKLCKEAFVRHLREIALLEANQFYNCKIDKKDNTNSTSNQEQEVRVYPRESLVIYCTAYPSDKHLAADEFAKSVLADRCLASQHTAVNSQHSMKKLAKPFSFFKTLLHTSVDKRYKLHKLDVDTKNPDDIEALKKLLQPLKIYVAVETRNGYHVICELGKAGQQLHAFAAANSTWLSIEGGAPLIAVPGTLQNNFAVRLTNIFDKIQ